jgi:predicted RNase H-like HicB family nuclease
MKESVVRERAPVVTIRWSAEDRCFVGSAPPFIGECCHGRTQSEVLGKLHTIIAEWIEIDAADVRAKVKGKAVRSRSNGFSLR